MGINWEEKYYCFFNFLYGIALYRKYRAPICLIEIEDDLIQRLRKGSKSRQAIKNILKGLLEKQLEIRRAGNNLCRLKGYFNGAGICST